MCMLQVSALAPVHQCQPMKPLHSVGGETTMVGHIVLGSGGHTFKQSLESVCLCSTGEGMLPVIVIILGLAIF